VLVGRLDEAGGIALQPGGNIVPVGMVLTGGLLFQLLCALFTPNEAVDDPFGSGGIVTTSFNSTPLANTEASISGPLVPTEPDATRRLTASTKPKRKRRPSLFHADLVLERGQIIT
jgi:hypothetical protein